jgi:small acid-soluble spore protein D (minor alpha/beta-type SASP)
MAGNNNDRLVPQAADALNRLKFEVAQEVGWNASSPQDLQQQIDRSKFEVAREIGVALKPGYNGDITSRDAGAVGGRLGGRLGGQMVKRMIAQAEQLLSGRK